jgi:hypothetical protein
MRTRVRVVTSAIVLVLASACGGGHSASVEVSSHPTSSGGALSDLAAGAPAGWKAVRFERATFDVPASWPVYDLRADQRRCVRYDTYAVYLGHQGPDAACPATALGKTNAVQVEPVDSQTRTQGLKPRSSISVNGHSATLDAEGPANHVIVATFNDLGLVISITYGRDQALSQQILRSVSST